MPWYWLMETVKPAAGVPSGRRTLTRTRPPGRRVSRAGGPPGFAPSAIANRPPSAIEASAYCPSRSPDTSKEPSAIVRAPVPKR